MSNAPARNPPRIKPTNMVKAAIKAAKDAGMEVVIEPDGVVTIRPVGERKKPAPKVREFTL